ncbi:type II toxin-antitoxin system VapC family toxin [Aquibium sp. ELW1220]|uniref:type II toxin-antitoxin system VapC family toxin n=1 Tax=Aquibium sp. ELW1220 TaxID=2976766 RepID=UPI0025B1823C|nr:type II toxin-antitoxin system VapC family toxin [Aquibium sp. ELW1220]MDN2582594.1 type II toxin-antitoxin system VapC family toxin [Aquibium sp. ELW1220]
MRWVVDASVAVKWIIAEEREEAADSLLSHGEMRSAPDLLLVEVANVLRNKLSKGQISLPHAQTGFRFVASAMTSLVPDRELVGRALDIAAELEHPVYDCMYIACAERENTKVVTADARFKRRTAQSRYATLVESLPI